MSKFGWIPEGIETHINAAVRCRVARWNDLPWSVQAELTKEEKLRVDSKRRRYKYMSSAHVRKALAYAMAYCATAFHEPDDWKAHFAILKKRLLKEIAKRYAVVDRAYDAHILLANGELRRIWK